MGGCMYRWLDEWMVGGVDGLINKWLFGSWIDRWVIEFMNSWMARCVDELMNVCVNS